jgi:hypothetical protein
LVVGGWQLPVQNFFKPFINDDMLREMFPFQYSTKKYNYLQGKYVICLFIPRMVIQLSLPQSTRDAFDILEQNGIIDTVLAGRLDLAFHIR